MQVGSQSPTYGASRQVFSKRHFHGDKSKHRGDFCEVYSKSSSIHFGEKKNAVLVLMDSESKGYEKIVNMS